MEVNLIGESLKFMVLGMSTVFMFLVLLVLVLNVQAKIIMKYFPSKEGNHNDNSTSGLLQKDNFAVVAAIAASIQSYNKKQQQ